jgi:hypothetical protein
MTVRANFQSIMFGYWQHNVEEEVLMEPAMTLLMCTTLPHDDAAGEAGDVNDGEWSVDPILI